MTQPATDTAVETQPVIALASPVSLSVEQGEEKPAFAPTPHEPLPDVTLWSHHEHPNSFGAMMHVDGRSSGLVIVGSGHFTTCGNHKLFTRPCDDLHYQRRFSDVIQEMAAQVRASRSQPVVPARVAPRVPELGSVPPDQLISVRALDDVTQDEACRQGGWAYTFGKHEKDNPYPLTLSAFAHWLHGFQDSWCDDEAPENTDDPTATAVVESPAPSVQSEPIPKGVYYNTHDDHFYDAEGRPKGETFDVTWFARADEFSKSRAAVELASVQPPPSAAPLEREPDTNPLVASRPPVEQGGAEPKATFRTCYHDRCNEEGYCRDCGEDCRSHSGPTQIRIPDNTPLSPAAPSPVSVAPEPKSRSLQKRVSVLEGKGLPVSSTPAASGGEADYFQRAGQILGLDERTLRNLPEDKDVKEDGLITIGGQFVLRLAQCVVMSDRDVAGLRESMNYYKRSAWEAKQLADRDRLAAENARLKNLLRDPQIYTTAASGSADSWITPTHVFSLAGLPKDPHITCRQTMKFSAALASMPTAADPAEEKCDA